MFGIKKLKEEVAQLSTEVKQLKCKHPLLEVWFDTEYLFGVSVGYVKKCSECGIILEKYYTPERLLRAKDEWADEFLGKKANDLSALHKKMGEKALADSLAGEKENIAANMAGAQRNTATPWWLGTTVACVDGHSMTLGTENIPVVGATETVGFIPCRKCGMSIVFSRETHTNCGKEKIKSEIVAEGDYIKKVKGRWIHEKSGKVLRVKK